MTNPGDSDEWWKQYGGEGVSSESNSPGSATPPEPPMAGQNSAPEYPAQPMTPPPQPYPSNQPGYPQAGQQQYGAPGQQQPPGYGYPGGSYQSPYQPYGYSAPQQGTNGLAIASLIVSIIGLCTCLGSVVGIILGIIGMNQIKDRGGEGRGMALAGIIIGGVGLAIWLIYIIVLAISAANS